DEVVAPHVPILVELVPAPRPLPPPPPPPPAEPAPKAGGGAPAAPSRVHVSPKPPPVPPELTAPPTPAPEPPLVIGVAETATPTPGPGLGGQGTGTGEGIGSGAGPGAGATRARFLRGPAPGQIRREYPREARRTRQTGQVQLECRIRLDTRLEGCRVMRETPAGLGFGPAAIRAAAAFRFVPPTAGGRVLSGETIVVGVEFQP
ncbi:MAG TPA: TonB family protein, partial [Caulobacteraceae bacterium]